MRNYKQSTSHSDRKTLFCSAHEELQWKKSGPGVIRLGNGSVLIGSNADAHILTEGEHMDCYLKAKDPKELVLKLLGRVFSEEELACNNFKGGKLGSLWQRKVVKDRLCTKIADIVFQGSVSSAKFQSIIQTAINGRRATFELRGVCTSLVKPSSTKSCHRPK